MAFALRKPAPVHPPVPAYDVAYQPVFDLERNGVFAYEALVRGIKGEGADSILSRISEEQRPAFEEHVSAMAITKAASLGIAASSAALLINITPDHPVHAVRALRSTLDAASRGGIARDRLVFELTEHVRMDPRQAQATVFAYRSHGLRTALDDFGAGYAGLLTLADLATDFVKIDMGLVRNIDASLDRRRIVGGMVRVLRELGRQVIAEGVETVAELDTLRSLGVTMVQGFLLGRPSLGPLQTRAYAFAG